jgi:serine/threonine protein kinase
MQHEHKIIMKQLLEALIELKSKGIVHRDIKPANIMIRVDEKTGEEECVLIDFGLAT